jgi:hypothetical protein
VKVIQSVCRGASALRQPDAITRRNQGDQTMSNMSYCRFRNTLKDLQDCADVINETDDLSLEEAAARKRLIRLCRDIAEETEGEED